MASLCRAGTDTEIAMSWSELERLVEDAEADGVMRRALRHCRSRRELLLAAARLGYAITSADLLQAQRLEQPSEPEGLHNATLPTHWQGKPRADQAQTPALLREAG
jgi:hypothetical protein